MTSPRRILVVEDDGPIRRGLVDALQSQGYEVLEAADGDLGLESALVEPVDLVVLDLMLPGRSGLEILADVRPVRPLLPIIILTALGGEDDRVRGLQLGADDYLAKPFSIRELLARVEAVIRRSPSRPVDTACFRIPGGAADLKQNELHFDDGRRRSLSEREAQLLRYLAASPGRAISREEILLHVWQVRPDGIETRTIDMHIARLREKLGDTSGSPRILKTVRGKGYMFDPGKMNP